MGTSARQARDEWVLTTLEGLLTPEQFAQLKAAREDSYWEAATRRGWTNDDLILEALSRRFRMKVANLSLVSQQARELVPEQLVRKYRVLPLQISDSILDIATSDPHDLDCERTLAFALGRTVRMSLGSPTKILERLDEVYRPENVIEKILEGVTGNYDIESISESVDEADVELGQGRATERPVIDLVNRIVAEGVQSRASDIHLEPEEAGVAVRYRIDGVLRQVMVLPKAAGIPLVSRVKIMAQLDIADRLRPQDGRARVAVSGNRVDLRVSTLPASQGEKVVIQYSRPARNGAFARWPRDEPGRARAHPDAVAGAGGDHPRHRSHGLRKDDDAVLDAAADPGARREHRDRRGSGRVPAAGDRAGAGEREKAGLTFPAPLRSILAPGPRRHSRRRSARQRDGHDRRARPRSRGTWCSRRCTRSTRRVR